MLLSAVIFIACTPGRKEAGPKPISYAIAPKTARADIISESGIVLQGHSFTIEYADSKRNYAALQTDWRSSSQTIRLRTGGEMTLEVRDRVTLHLSPRAVQSDRTTMVASHLEFEMQTQSPDRKKWLDITPDQAYQEQYARIVYDIQNRMRRLGYQFN